MASTRRVRVLIADDHALVAEGLNTVLSNACEVVGISRTGTAVLEDVARLKPDLVCLDISMPELNGIQAAMKLSEQYPRLKIVFVTQQLEVPYVKAAFRAGATGYVCKQSASSEILTAIREVLSGRRFITPLVREEQFRPADLSRDPERVYSDRLTERQRQVLQLVAEGKTNREMSEILSISLKTVEFHKNMLMNELGLRTTAELTRYAMTNRLVV